MEQIDLIKRLLVDRMIALAKANHWTVESVTTTNTEIKMVIKRVIQEQRIE